MTERLVVESNNSGAPAPARRMSWGAVLAGVVVTLGVQLLLSLLGVGIGASTVNPLQQENPVAGLGTGAAIWFLLSALLALFAGGWATGRLAAVPRTERVLHGVLTWGMAALLTFYLLTTTVGALIGGAARVLSEGVSLLAKGTAAATPAVAGAVREEVKGVDWDGIKDEARTLLRQTGKPELDPDKLEGKARDAGQDAKATARAAGTDPLAADEEFRGLLGRLFGRGSEAVDAADREALVNVVAARTGKSKPEAEKVVANWERAYQRARERYEEVKAQAAQKAREAGDATAWAVSRAALWSFAALMFGLGAAVSGALVSMRHGRSMNRTGRVETPPALERMSV